MSKMITIGSISRDSDEIALVVRKLREYIREQPAHKHGVCSWLGVYHDVHVYGLIAQARHHFPSLARFGADSYVSSAPGPTPRRLEFAAALRDELQRLLDQHSLCVAGVQLTQGQAVAPLAQYPAPVPAAVVAERRPNVGTQLYEVLLALRAGHTTLSAIADEAGCLETAASARIRELRNKYGWNIEVRRAPGKAQRFTYHLISN
jgi:hypothetical protein